jgi:DNA-binding response OmpR family regulator
MSYRDGLEVLDAIHAASPGTDVIMLTGHGSIDTAIQSVRAGAFDYFAKPCPLDELEVRIQRALERLSLRRRASLLERALTPPDVGGRGGAAGLSHPQRWCMRIVTSRRCCDLSHTGDRRALDHALGTA